MEVDIKNLCELLQVAEEEAKHKVYSSVDTPVESCLIIEEDIVYPYQGLSAKEASRDIKSGYVSMRKRHWFGFKKTKKVYATIHNKWLLIYDNEKDIKPISTFELKKYEAKQAESVRSSHFELTNNQQTYYFTALTPKDMLQWVTYINRSHDDVVLRSKGFDLEQVNDLINDDIEQHYDSIVIPIVQNKDEEEENIYLELDDMVRRNTYNNNGISPSKSTKEKESLPTLPVRRQGRKNTSIPVAPPVIRPLPLPSRHSFESNITCDIKEKAECPMSDDEDEHYEAFVDIKDTAGTNQSQISKHISNQITDQLSSQITNQTSSEVPKNILSQSREEILNQISKQISSKILSNSSNQISSEISKESTNQCLKEISEPISNTTSNFNTVLNKISIQISKQNTCKNSPETSGQNSGKKKLPALPVKPKIGAKLVKLSSDATNK